MTDAPPLSSTSRAQFRLIGPSRPFDASRQAIRPDLADAAEAAHHFAPHYAAPAPCRTVRDTILREAASDESAQRCALAAGAEFSMLDQTGDWAWGYADDGHIVGYVRAQDIAPAEAT